MEQKILRPGFLSGQIKIPPSKSHFQRLLLGGARCPQTSTLRATTENLAADIKSMISAVKRLGAEVEIQEDLVKIKGTTDTNFRGVFALGESGLGSRMLAGVLALSPHRTILDGHGTLLQRPMGSIHTYLEPLGAKIQSNNGRLPIQIIGPIHGGRLEVDGSKSSQYLSGLLMALPHCAEPSEISVSNLASIPYVGLTLDVLQHFGITITHQNFANFQIPANQEFQGVDLAVEGDWSGAAPWIVAAALNGHLSLQGLEPDSQQADRIILDVLSAAEVFYSWEKGNLLVHESDIKAFNVDLTNAPDLFPPLAALASFGEGISKLKGLTRLTHKESNRSRNIQELLKACGLRFDVKNDCLEIFGQRELKPATLFSYNDHRMAMMAAILSLRAKGPTILNGAQAISKSYPGFWDSWDEVWTTQKPADR